MRMTQHLNLGYASALGVTRPVVTPQLPFVIATAGNLGMMKHSPNILVSIHYYDVVKHVILQCDLIHINVYTCKNYPAK